MKHHKFTTAALLLSLTLCSCEDFLNTVPKDALTPPTTWKTPDDVDKFVVGCYDGWIEAWTIMYWDAASDLAYNNFPWEGFTVLGNGSMTAGNPGSSFYDFSNVQRCDVVLDNIDKVAFSDDSRKKDLIAQVRTLRAYDYFFMNFLYGGVPIVKYFTSAEEAQVPRETEEKVKQYVYDEIDAAIPDLKDVPAARGRVAKGAALAIKMRSALYWGDYQRAKEAAKEIIELKQYDLEPVYSDLFTLAGRDSKEIILATQCIPSTHTNGTVGQFYNNGDGGWSSVVPTKNLVDLYEMADGQTKEESVNYDPTHPFKGRDPRLAMTVLYPGASLEDGGIFNTLDKNLPSSNANPNYPTAADNSSKTALTWVKYLYPMSQYSDIWDTGCSPIVFRYADVLLTYAEASNELDGPSTEVYDMLDKIRLRAGMPAVDRNKYDTKETLRTFIRRERSVELAGEGLRRADLLRWKDDAGKMMAETVMNQPLLRYVGSVDYSQPDPELRATVKPGEEAVVEERQFKPYNRYLPIPQDNMDKNPKLTQNLGY
ncbi:MAG: RagB/SusD family nutrient uptake outer membrane protein [Mediterranea sp.]|jgi:hypothetical protein|nr:RagB/SusD family nutrient uptake outer membrane protein [Mediterranea sp.]